MVEVYALSIEQPGCHEDLGFLPFVTEQKRERLRRYISVLDAKRSLYAEILIRWIVARKFGVRNSQIIFAFGEFGKPSLRDYPGFHFNLSHSGRWVVCATSVKEVGIDIEQVLPLDDEIVKEALTRQEQLFLQGLAGRQQAEFFFSIWTKKESFLKCLGQGMHFPLTWINCVSHDDDAVIQLSDETHLNLVSYDVDEGYKLSVCSVDSRHDEGVQHVKLESVVLS